MDIFFSLLRKSLVGFLACVFALVLTYTPQDWSKVKLAHAGGGFATETTQVAQWGTDKIFQGVSIAQETLTAVATTAFSSKDVVLDGLAWAVAKMMVKSMVQSLINWINSGFQGSPAFVQDLEGFLRNAADQAIGEYISELGAVGSFICEPFRLDVQIAVALQYSQARENQPAPDCTLTGVINNIEGFLSGAQGSFSQGGWNDWFDITSQPNVYTPYGAILSGQSGASMRIVNAQGVEGAKLEWGDGFLSGEICETVHGGGVTTEQCFISKPGKIIQEALTFNLDSGRQSLIAADEVNEIISALIGQLANTVFTGAAGLLGLSSGTGYTYSGFNAGSYIDEMAVETTSVTGDISNMMGDALKTQQKYSRVANRYLANLTTLVNDPSTEKYRVRQAKRAIADIEAIIKETVGDTNTTGSIDTLKQLIADYQALPSKNTPKASEKRAAIVQEYSQLNLYTEQQITESEDAWKTILN